MSPKLRDFFSGLRVAEFLVGATGLALTVLVNPTDFWSKALVVAGVALVVLSLGFASWREFQREEDLKSAAALAAEFEEKFGIALHSAITPIAHLIGRIAAARTATRRRALKEALKQKVVDSLLDLCLPTEGKRTVLFELRDDEIVPGPWSGRGDAPRTIFRREDEDQVFLHLASHEITDVADMANPPPGIVIARTSTVYQCFLSVAVYSEGQEFGMLNIDASEKAAFDQGDRNTLVAMAQLLGAGLAIKD